MFKEQDKKIILSLQKIIVEGDFLLKGRSVPGFIMILKWIKELEDKIDLDLKPKPVKTVDERLSDIERKVKQLR